MSGLISDQVIAVIPAAGVGKRMGAAIPKQYLNCAGRPIIWHTLNQFHQHNWVDKIYVALSDDDQYWSELIGNTFDRVQVVTGGSCRAESVKNALWEASKHYPAYFITT